MNKLSIILDTEKIGELSENNIELDLTSYNIDDILDVRTHHYGYFSYIFDKSTKILNVKTNRHCKIIINFYSVLEERDLKLKKLLNL